MSISRSNKKIGKCHQGLLLTFKLQAIKTSSKALLGHMRHAGKTRNKGETNHFKPF